MKAIMKQISGFIVFNLIFLFLGGISFYIFSSTRFVSEAWHKINLKEEFRASRLKDIPDFEAYLELENRLFKELHEKVYFFSEKSNFDFNRYNKGSRSDPSEFSINWNRSFKLPVENPKGGILMIHGLTDSPYSIRVLAQRMQKKGFLVIGLRLPGHGTIPSELCSILWKDWATAIRIGARQIEGIIGDDLPLYLLGYSAGAALAVEYALSAIDGEALPEIEGLILLSAALDLPSFAALAKYQLGLSRLPGLKKLAWESVSPEYDPYKYNSFPVNAGKQIYDLTRNIQKQISKIEKNNKLSFFPKVLAFQSIVDDTIKAEGVVDKFLIHLTSEKNLLVVYDVNQQIRSQGLLLKTGEAFKRQILNQGSLPFTVELVTNMAGKRADLRGIQRKAWQKRLTWKKIGLSWPPGIYSLSHVALPFSPSDPVYGNLPVNWTGPIRLGNINLKGEKKTFVISEKNLIRLRYNPFYEHLENHLLSFIHQL